MVERIPKRLKEGCRDDNDPKESRRRLVIGTIPYEIDKNLFN
jgi:hypothetical protein